MRSFVCCGVSRTACARLGGARTSIPSRALAAKHLPGAPSLAGCILDDPCLIIQPASLFKSGISRSRPAGNGVGRGISHLRRGEKRHQEKDIGVGRNVQVEINEAVHENSTTCGETGKAKSCSKITRSLLKRPQRDQE